MLKIFLIIVLGGVGFSNARNLEANMIFPDDISESDPSADYIHFLNSDSSLYKEGSNTEDNFDKLFENYDKEFTTTKPDEALRAEMNNTTEDEQRSVVVVVVNNNFNHGENEESPGSTQTHTLLGGQPHIFGSQRPLNVEDTIPKEEVSTAAPTKTTLQKISSFISNAFSGFGGGKKDEVVDNIDDDSIRSGDEFKSERPKDVSIVEDEKTTPSLSLLKESTNNLADAFNVINNIKVVVKDPSKTENISRKNVKNAGTVNSTIELGLGVLNNDSNLKNSLAKVVTDYGSNEDLMKQSIDKVLEILEINTELPQIFSNFEESAKTIKKTDELLKTEEITENYQKVEDKLHHTTSFLLKKEFGADDRDKVAKEESMQVSNNFQTKSPGIQAEFKTVVENEAILKKDENTQNSAIAEKETMQVNNNFQTKSPEIQAEIKTVVEKEAVLKAGENTQNAAVAEEEGMQVENNFQTKSPGVQAEIKTVVEYEAVLKKDENTQNSVVAEEEGMQVENNFQTKSPGIQAEFKTVVENEAVLKADGNTQNAAVAEEEGMQTNNNFQTKSPGIQVEFKTVVEYEAVLKKDENTQNSAVAEEEGMQTNNNFQTKSPGIQAEFKTVVENEAVLKTDENTQNSAVAEEEGMQVENNFQTQSSEIQVEIKTVVENEAVLKTDENTQNSAVAEEEGMQVKSNFQTKSPGIQEEIKTIVEHGAVLKKDENTQNSAIAEEEAMQVNNNFQTQSPKIQPEIKTEVEKEAVLKADENTQNAAVVEEEGIQVNNNFQTISTEIQDEIKTVVGNEAVLKTGENTQISAVKESVRGTVNEYTIDNNVEQSFKNLKTENASEALNLQESVTGISLKTNSSILNEEIKTNFSHEETVEKPKIIESIDFKTESPQNSFEIETVIKTETLLRTAESITSTKNLQNPVIKYVEDIEDDLSKNKEQLIRTGDGANDIIQLVSKAATDGENVGSKKIIAEDHKNKRLLVESVTDVQGIDRKDIVLFDSIEISEENNKMAFNLATENYEQLETELEGSNKLQQSVTENVSVIFRIEGTPSTALKIVQKYPLTILNNPQYEDIKQLTASDTIRHEEYTSEDLKSKEPLVQENEDTFLGNGDSISIRNFNLTKTLNREISENVFNNNDAENRKTNAAIETVQVLGVKEKLSNISSISDSDEIIINDSVVRSSEFLPIEAVNDLLTERETDYSNVLQKPEKSFNVNAKSGIISNFPADTIKVQVQSDIFPNEADHESEPTNTLPKEQVLSVEIPVDEMADKPEIKVSDTTKFNMEIKLPIEPLKFEEVSESNIKDIELKTQINIESQIQDIATHIDDMNSFKNDIIYDEVIEEPKIILAISPSQNTESSNSQHRADLDLETFEKIEQSRKENVEPKENRREPENSGDEPDRPREVQPRNEAVEEVIEDVIENFGVSEEIEEILQKEIEESLEYSEPIITETEPDRQTNYAENKGSQSTTNYIPGQSTDPLESISEEDRSNFNNISENISATIAIEEVKNAISSIPKTANELIIFEDSPLKSLKVLQQNTAPEIATSDQINTQDSSISSHSEIFAKNVSGNLKTHIETLHVNHEVLPEEAILRSNENTRHTDKAEETFLEQHDINERQNDIQIAEQLYEAVIEEAVEEARKDEKDLSVQSKEQLSVVTNGDVSNKDQRLGKKKTISVLPQTVTVSNTEDAQLISLGQENFQSIEDVSVDSIVQQKNSNQDVKSITPKLKEDISQIKNTIDTVTEYSAEDPRDMSQSSEVIIFPNERILQQKISRDDVEVTANGVNISDRTEDNLRTDIDTDTLTVFDSTVKTENFIATKIQTDVNDKDQQKTTLYEKSDVIQTLIIPSENSSTEVLRNIETNDEVNVENFIVSSNSQKISVVEKQMDRTDQSERNPILKTITKSYEEPDQNTEVKKSNRNTGIVASSADENTFSQENLTKEEENSRKDILVRIIEHVTDSNAQDNVSKSGEEALTEKLKNKKETVAAASENSEEINLHENKNNDSIEDSLESHEEFKSKLERKTVTSSISESNEDSEEDSREDLSDDRSTTTYWDLINQHFKHATESDPFIIAHRRGKKVTLHELEQQYLSTIGHSAFQGRSMPSSEIIDPESIPFSPNFTPTKVEYSPAAEILPKSDDALTVNKKPGVIRQDSEITATPVLPEEITTPQSFDDDQPTSSVLPETDSTNNEIIDAIVEAAELTTELSRFVATFRSVMASNDAILVPVTEPSRTKGNLELVESKLVANNIPIEPSSAAYQHAAVNLAVILVSSIVILFLILSLLLMIFVKFRNQQGTLDIQMEEQRSDMETNSSQN